MMWVAPSVGWVSFLEVGEAEVASVFQLVELSSYLEVGEEGVGALVFLLEVLVSYLGEVVGVEEGTFHSLEGEVGEEVADFRQGHSTEISLYYLVASVLVRSYLKVYSRQEEEYPSFSFYSLALPHCVSLMSCITNPCFIIINI